jgi:hypothetical protein
MNHKAAFLLLFIIPGLCSATTVIFGWECGLLNRVASVARSQSDVNATALQLLEAVAKGRTESIDDAQERRAGLVPGQLREKEFNDEYIREFALQKIGESGIPEALVFLVTLKRTDLRSDAPEELWRTSQIALANARLNGIASTQSKVEFLMGTLGTIADSWAVEELCNRGVLQSLPGVMASIRRSYGSHEQRSDDEIAFCEARMQVIARDPDRVRALETVLDAVLTLHHNAEGRRLLNWAMYQLDAIHSADGDAALDRFATDAGIFLHGNPGDLNLLSTKQVADLIRQKRAN